MSRRTDEKVWSSGYITLIDERTARENILRFCCVGGGGGGVVGVGVVWVGGWGLPVRYSNIVPPPAGRASKEESEVGCTALTDTHPRQSKR